MFAGFFKGRVPKLFQDQSKLLQYFWTHHVNFRICLVQDEKYGLSWNAVVGRFKIFLSLPTLRWWVRLAAHQWRATRTQGTHWTAQWFVIQIDATGYFTITRKQTWKKQRHSNIKSSWQSYQKQGWWRPLCFTDQRWICAKVFAIALTAMIHSYNLFFRFCNWNYRRGMCWYIQGEGNGRGPCRE